MFGSRKIVVCSLLWLIAGAYLVAVPAHESRAQAAPEVYRDKTITIVVGSGAGGTYALYAQLLARHWPSHIGGEPAVIVQYMPGGGGLKVANYLHNVAPSDGSIVGMPVQTVAMVQVLQADKSRHDVRDWHWIGNMAVLRSTIAVWHTAPVRTMQAARERELIIGSTGRGGDMFMVPQLAKELAGARFKIVLGYRGSSDVDKAIESGEVEGRAGSWLSWKLRHPDWIKDEKVVPLVQIGMTRAPDLPDVPLLQELVNDPTDKQVVEFFAYSSLLARPLVSVPKTPKEMVDTLRQAFTAVMKDEEMVADAAKRGIPLEPMGWREVEKAALSTANVSPAIVARMREVLAR